MKVNYASCYLIIAITLLSFSFCQQQCGSANPNSDVDCTSNSKEDKQCCLVQKGTEKTCKEITGTTNKQLMTEIKKFDTALTLSIGERSFEDYKAFKEVGADRYLLRIETTDEKLYSKLHPNMDFKNRIRCLHDLKKLGYETGTGCLIGLPNQSLASLADDILFFKSLNADMVGVGPFIAHPNTPLKHYNNGDFMSGGGNYEKNLSTK